MSFDAAGNDTTGIFKSSREKNGIPGGSRRNRKIMSLFANVQNMDSMDYQ